MRQSPVAAQGSDQTVEAYDEIVKVILHGRVINRAEVAANRAADGVGRGAVKEGGRPAATYDLEHRLS
jgi:hypothetical protein